jgi:phosphonate transport system substrate-binding protein
MLTRRSLIAATTAAATAAAAAPARAQSWKAAYPELTYAIIPAENASTVTERYGPFMAYLTKELGTKVTLRIANDYAAVIEGQRSGNVHICSYGPTSFARARMTGVKTEAILIEVYAGGRMGYYTAFYTRAADKYKTIQDLKGKNIAFVDPNSASGYTVPLYKLNQLGIKPSEFFGKVVFAGSHDNAMIALAQGTVDVGVTWFDDETDSNLTKMVGKGMLKKADGTPYTNADFSVVLKSDIIINSPVAVLSDLPAELKAAIKQAFLDAPTKDHAAFAKLSDNMNFPWQPIDSSAYDDTIKMVKFVDSLRKS